MKILGSLRLGNGLGFGASAGFGEADNKPGYIESLTKLFPVEGVTLVSFVPGFSGGKWWVGLICCLIITGIIILLRLFATKPPSGGKTDWVALIVSCISFWLYSMTLGVLGIWLDPPERHTQLMAFISTAWIMLVPLIPKKS
jgi:hypothetical protein